MSKRIIRIDASGIRGAAGCLRKLFLTVVSGYTSGKLLNDIEYGSAFHVFKQELYLTSNAFAAFQAGSNYFRKRELNDDGKPNDNFVIRKNKEWLNLIHLCDTMTAYVDLVGEKHEKDNLTLLKRQDGVPRVEQTFEIPLHEDDEFIIFLVGTIDGVGQLRDGCHVIADTKTTATWDTKGYFAPYKMNPQIATYLWSVRWHLKNKVGLSELEGKEVRAVIDGVFLSKTNPTKFERSEAFRYTDNMLDDFEIGLMGIVNELIQHIRTGKIPYREGLVHDSCGGKFKDVCPFFNACALPDDDSFVSVSYYYDTYIRSKGYDLYRMRGKS